MDVKTLLQYTDSLLNSSQITDYCPNGLQVEGSRIIRNLVSGVTASQELIHQAIHLQADAVLVHHGYFWKNENPRLVGMKGARIRQLMQHDINLIAYHLPLDLHPIYGNNALWGKEMGWAGKPSDIEPLIYVAELDTPMSIEDFQHHLSIRLKRTPLHLSGGNATISRVAWCSGGAQNFIDKVVDLEVDAFLSGEASEPTTHSAKELGIDYFACGHHATEIFGVRALGMHLAEKFSLNHQFIDIPNPV